MLSQWLMEYKYMHKSLIISIIILSLGCIECKGQASQSKIDSAYTIHNSPKKVVNITEIGNDIFERKIQDSIADQSINSLQQKLGIPTEFSPRISNVNFSANDDLATTKNSYSNKILQKASGYLANPQNFGGNVHIEFYASDQRMPYQQNAPNYIRVSAQPLVNILNIPFKANLYYTTEDNSFYNSNTFGLHLDTRLLSFNKEVAALDKLNDLKAQQKMNVNYRERVDLYMSDLRRNLELEKRNASKAIPSIGLSDKIEKSVQYNMDSSNSHYSQKLADSLTLVKDKQQLYEDSIQNVINDLQHLLDVANKLKMNLVNRDSFLDLKTAEAKNVYDSFCNSKSSKVRKVIKQHDWLSSIRNLDMGVIYPFLSASTINGIPLKGLNVTTQRKWVEIQVTGGRTMSDYSFFSNSQGNLFDRNTVGVKTGFQLIDRGQIYVVSSTLWDAVKKTQNESGLNSVNGFGWTYQPNSKISITGEALSSFTHSSEVASGRSELTGLGSLLDRTLFLGEIKYVITPASQVQIKYDRRSIGFQSWGSPFMLTNLREIQIKWKQFLWRKQIAILGSFKNLRRNPGSIENKSSSLRGFGFHVNTNFRRYPNIQFMHLPYQQGNNHADTLFRTNNRLSTTIFNVTHTYTAKTFRTTWVGYYTNSQVEYFQLENEILKTSIVSFTQRIEFARSSVELSMMRSHVLPEVDSVQFTGLSFRSNYKLRGLTLLCSANYRHTKSNSQMLRASMGVEKNTYNGLRIGLELGVFYYNGLWGFIDDWSQFGRMTVAYTINKGPKIIKGH